MKVWKEVKFYSFESECADRNIAVVLLENGALLVVRDDGTAIGTDGLSYVNVSKENVVPAIPTDHMHIETRVSGCKNPPDVETDTELETVGWTTDADHPVIL